MNLRDHVDHAISQADEGLNPGDLADMDEVEKINVQKVYRETLHQCYGFGFEVTCTILCFIVRIFRLSALFCGCCIMYSA